MSAKDYTDDLSATVRYALETTRAIAVCPFHSDVTIRVGDDAAESHAFERAKRIIKSDGTTWKPQAVGERLVGSHAKPQTVNVRTARHIDRPESGAELRGNRARWRLLLQQ